MPPTCCGRFTWGYKYVDRFADSRIARIAGLLRLVLTPIGSIGYGNRRFAIGIFYSKDLYCGGGMHKICLLIFVFLSVYAGSGIAVRAQLPLYGCTRSQFEAYAEAERRPAIQYFNAARELADKNVKLFVEGRITELYSGLSPSVKETRSEKDFRAELEVREGYTGKVLDYSYRDQGFTYADPTHVDFHQGFATTIYFARASHWDGTVIIKISTAQTDSTIVFTGIELLRADPSTDIEKIYRKGRSERCRGYASHP